ncbi:MAG: HAMP domain-containing protein [Sphingomonas sp.]|uniref:sensor histidine kinase NtrY-like n=1 Tax=Sphingomonas sp. TaxID=28214 RepID=UPI0025D6A7FB|nr:ATP-binding protein [Sphingomonas sp.]MBY0283881.1 HAMP domain-containing protein [Sphingomonas sp.]
MNDPVAVATPERPGVRPVAPLIEIGVLAVAVAVAIGSYLLIARGSSAPTPLSSPLIAAMLIANLLPWIALLVLGGRRIAMRRAARSPMGGRGRLHVRLVATFSILASVPIILTVIAASVMFELGVDYWVSDRARNAFNATMGMVDEGQKEIIKRWLAETNQLVKDIDRYYPTIPKQQEDFQLFFNRETYFRNLEQSVLFRYQKGAGIQVLYVFNPPTEAQFAQRINPAMLDLVGRDKTPYINRTTDTVWLIAPVPNRKDTFVYAGTSVTAAFLSRQHIAASALVKDYAALQKRTRSIQLTFNLILFAVALLIVAVAVWIALQVADRLVRPIDALVGAAHRIASGELSARVPTPKVEDEIGALGNAFNSMTEQLQAQTDALVAANDQLDSRRALIEAVVSGVSAGVISVDRERRIRLINRSALALLRAGEAAPISAKLADLSPELDALLDAGNPEAVIQIAAQGEARTLAVKIAVADAGPILTFDDITQQLLDQRRAAWSDVARRIAHEIKNPLTPIQLAAERLQRRYGKQLPEDDGTFARLTETIVRQVGDLRRMVDEFSSFARMPKPVFREESLLDIARQVMFLHEVAHGSVTFELVHDEPPPSLVCDRRQLAQALTNIVKNAVEAVQSQDEGAAGNVTLTIAAGDNGRVTIFVADDGVGLPVERDRIVEPYMTTRARGTGLGLAIVKKIVDEHLGTITFADRPGGGTIVTLCFDPHALAQLAASDTDRADLSANSGEERAPVLTRIRK